jgi:ribose transport system permease protein
MTVVALGGVRTRGRHYARRLFAVQEFPVILAFVALMLIFSIMAPHQFATISNFQNLATNFSVLLVLAVGMTFVIVTAGIDLSIGSVLVVASIVSAKAMAAVSGRGGGGWGTVVVGLLAGLATGAGWGLLNGFLIARIRLPALIVTLGTLGMSLSVAELLTGGFDIAGVPTPLVNTVAIGQIGGIPDIFVIGLVVTAVGGLVLGVTRFGRHTYAIGSNEEAARRAGIHVTRHLIVIYGLMGLLAGLAGFLSLGLYTTTSMQGHSADNLQVIAGVVLGGTSLFGGIGTIFGSLLGIFIPAILQNGFIIVGVQPFWQEFAIGAVLIAAVYIDRLKRQAQQKQ